MTALEQSQTAVDSGSASGDASVLEWRTHLLVEQPGRLAALLGSALFCTTVAWLLFHNLLFSLAALFMLASATSEYFFPVAYRLTDRCAACRYGANRFELEWSKVKRVLLYADGIRLSPLAFPSRLDAYRGVYLHFAPDGQQGDRESVLSAIETLRPSAESEGTS